MESFLPVVTKKECCKIFLSDIVYIEKDARIVRIVTENDTYSEYGNISDFEPYFEDDDRFCICFKGLIINLDHVISMKNQSILFSNGKHYDLGRTNFLKAKQTFVNYMRSTSKKVCEKAK